MSPRRRRQPLPTTSYIVLGLLTFRPEMSGYDLKQLADRAVVHFYWSPARNQIYAELRRLTACGYVTERQVVQEHRPNKRLYRLTPAGERALRAWLENTEFEPTVFKSTFLLKFYFGKHVSREATLARLEACRREAQAMVAMYEAREGELRDREDRRFQYLTLRYGLLSAQATLAWVDEALAQLNT